MYVRYEWNVKLGYSVNFTNPFLILHKIEWFKALNLCFCQYVYRKFSPSIVSVSWLISVSHSKFVENRAV